MSFLGRPEVWVLIALALLFFGPKRLPEMGSAIGKTIKEFQHSMKDTKPEVAPPAETPQISAAPVAAAPVITAPAATVTPAPTATATPASTVTTPPVVEATTVE